MDFSKELLHLKKTQKVTLKIQNVNKGCYELTL